MHQCYTIMRAHKAHLCMTLRLREHVTYINDLITALYSFIKQHHYSRRISAENTKTCVQERIIRS